MEMPCSNGYPLLNVNSAAIGFFFLRVFGHGDRQNAIVVRSLDLIFFDSAQVKATRVAAIAALTADVAAIILILLLLFLTVLCLYGEAVVLNADMDILLIKSRKFRFQHIPVAFIQHVGAYS